MLKHIIIILHLFLSIPLKAQIDTAKSVNPFKKIDKEQLLLKIENNKELDFHLIYTFAYWCKPCVEKTPEVVSFLKKEKSIKTYFIDFEENSQRYEPSLSFLKKAKYNGEAFGIDTKYGKKEKKRYKSFIKSFIDESNTDNINERLGKYFGLSKCILFDKYGNIIYVSTWKDEDKINKIKEAMRKYSKT